MAWLHSLPTRVLGPLFDLARFESASDLEKERDVYSRVRVGESLMGRSSPAPSAPVRSARGVQPSPHPSAGGSPPIALRPLALLRQNAPFVLGKRLCQVLKGQGFFW